MPKLLLTLASTGAGAYAAVLPGQKLDVTPQQRVR
jgi:hypothetical protein